VFPPLAFCCPPAERAHNKPAAATSNTTAPIRFNRAFSRSHVSTRARTAGKGRKIVFPIGGFLGSAVISFCAIHQVLAGDAVANPWNGLQTLDVNLLLAVEALAERALTDPFQRGVDCTQERSVPRFLTKVKFSRQRRVGAITLVLAVVVLRSQ